MKNKETHAYNKVTLSNGKTMLFEPQTGELFGKKLLLEDINDKVFGTPRPMCLVSKDDYLRAVSWDLPQLASESMWNAIARAFARPVRDDEK